MSPRAAALVWLLIASSCGMRTDRPAPPVLLSLPDFRLVDQAGKPFGRADLLGHVWVADFVFLGCAHVCPRLTARMRSLQDRFGERLRLVTFSVDPTNDTPPRLAAYAAAHGANPETWTFVTGASADVERAVVKGFKIAMGAEPVSSADRKTDIVQIFHGEHFVLVDREGRIRGYYTADDVGLADLATDARRIL